MDRQEAVETAARMWLDNPSSLYEDPEREAATARARELGATYDDLHNEIARQRAEHP